MIKVSDYIVKRLEEHGVKQAFMITGGAAMHLNDSVGRSEKISCLHNHHEQASAMAAEGYARVSGKLPVVVVTSGPGGTNAITGLIGQWLDSVPCLYLSGQVRQETMGAGRDDLRQLGDQEINIIDIVRPVTKFSEVVRKAEDIPWLLEEAIYYATSGRPGPVWLDIPLDIQESMIDVPFSVPDYIRMKRRIPIDWVADLLQKSERPLLLAGRGVRIAGAEKLFLALAERMGIPVVTSFNGMDLIPSDHPLFSGRVGTIGTPAGNRALQNCDLLISIGSRNNIRQIGYKPGVFAHNAKKVIVDIDAAELKKSTINPDIAICADAGYFMETLLHIFTVNVLPGWSGWVSSCRSSAPSAPVREKASGVDPYHFIGVLTESLPDDAVIVSGNGTASVALFQAGVVKKNTRIIMNSGCASMGYDLPAAIGACLANGRGNVVCITGDGSIQMNIQELQTIAHHRLPIKIFVLNNDGYKSIQLTQDNYFEGRHVGADHDSGVSCPDSTKVAMAYGLSVKRIDDHESMFDHIRSTMNFPGPLVCEAMLAPDYTFNKQNLASFEPSCRTGERVSC